MAEPSWSEGYVVDVDYTQGFYRELTPGLLRFVTVLGQVHSVDTDAPYTYYELGCGHGRSTALLAATNPKGRFFGVDFNPTHIRNARELAEGAGLANVRFLEKSFAELLETDLPEADIIALHGVWSWIGAEHREQILELVRRRLKPGGVVYVSYNCLPGFSQVAPLQRLLFEHAAQGGGERMERVRRSLDFAARLRQAGAGFFETHPVATLRLEGVRNQDPNYVAHEYFNANWSPSYHLDVVREMGQAKLSFVGSAGLSENFEQFVVKPEVAKLLAEAGERAMRETVKDFARNQAFRRDVFTRGASRASAQERDALLGRTRFALATPRAACKLAAAMPVGEVKLQPQVYAPVLDALARSPMTFDELGIAPEAAALGAGGIRQAVFGMAAFGNVLPVPAPAPAAHAAAARLNGALLARAEGTGSLFLAAPTLGTGMPLGFLDRLLLAHRDDPQGASDKAAAAMAERGIAMRKNDGSPAGNDEARALIAERTRLFFDHLLPFLRYAGVVD